MPRRKSDHNTSNNDSMQCYSYDSSDDELELVNIPPEDDISDAEESDAGNPNKKLTPEEGVQNILGRVEVQLHVDSDRGVVGPVGAIDNQHGNVIVQNNGQDLENRLSLVKAPSIHEHHLYKQEHQHHLYKQGPSFAQDQYAALFAVQNPQNRSLHDHLAGFASHFQTSHDSHSLFYNSNVEQVVNQARSDLGYQPPFTPVPIEQPVKRPRLEPDWRLERPVYTKWTSPVPEGKNLDESTLKELVALSPVEIFEKLFTAEISNFIRIQTITYAVGVKNDIAFTLEEHELKAFIGFLLFSSYVTMPNERMYWASEATVGQKLVKEAISRSSYTKIKTYLQLYDRTTATTKDRGFKVKPFITMLNKAFLRFGVFEKNITIGKLIVPAEDEEKFFLKRKPKKCGYKLWTMCGAEEGYCFKFDLYCGDKKDKDDAALGSQVVLKMTEAIPNPNNHYVYFDKYFTSMELLQNLRERGLRASGGVKDTRLPNCNIKPKQVLLAENPGSFDHRFDKNTELLTVRWHANKYVSCMTNYDDIKPTCIAKYYNVQEKLKTSVTQPKAMKDYVNGSRGVSHIDWFLAKHDIKVRGRKWYWCLFVKILDIVVVNSWILHKCAVTKANKTLNILDFRREIAESYLKVARAAHKRRGATCSSNKGGAAQLSKQIPSSLRFDGIHHYIAKRDTGKRCRCQYTGCIRKSLTYCTKCCITVCLDCFVKFHTKENYDLSQHMKKQPNAYKIPGQPE